MSFIVFIIGLLLGSFLNSFIWRYRKNILETIFNDRSMCPCCGHTLEVNDLIPVFSFVVLGGKCRYCGSKISWQYPFVEIFFATLTLLLYWQIGFGMELVFYTVIAFLLTALMVIDIYDGVLPNKLILTLIIIAFFGMIAGGNSQLIWRDMVLGGVAGLGFFMALWIVTLGKGIGMGDIKLALALGMLIGYSSVWQWVVLSFVMGSVYVIPMLFSGRKKWKSEVAFGPFMILAFWLVYFWGEQIDMWMWRML